MTTSQGPELVVAAEEPYIFIYIVKRINEGYKTTKVHLPTFEILRVGVPPYEYATVDIVIEVVNNEIERTVFISGSD